MPSFFQTSLSRKWMKNTPLRPWLKFPLLFLMSCKSVTVTSMWPSKQLQTMFLKAMDGSGKITCSTQILMQSSSLRSQPCGLLQLCSLSEVHGNKFTTFLLLVTIHTVKILFNRLKLFFGESFTVSVNQPRLSLPSHHFLSMLPWFF